MSLRKLVGNVAKVLMPTAVALGVSLACSGEKAEKRGQLIVAFQTDLDVPKDIQTLVVSIYSGPNKIYQQGFALAPSGQFYLPGTLAVVAGEKREPVVIRVTGVDATGQPRVLRQAVSSVPTDRIALLHLPLQFLCVKSVTKGIDIDGTDSYTDDCTAKEQSCIAGTCVPDEVDEALLPTFAQELVFGGAKGPGAAGGQCLDVLPCFQDAYEEIPDTSNCSIALPFGSEQPQDGTGGGSAAPPGGGTDTQASEGAERSNVNIGLELAPGSPGLCDGARCIVSLDNDPVGGWREENGRAILPRAVCDRLGSTIQRVLVTQSCVTKTKSIPTCGPWSNVGGGGQPQNEGGSGEGGVMLDPCTNAEDGTWCSWEIGVAGEALYECLGRTTQQKTDCGATESCVVPPSAPRSCGSGGDNDSGSAPLDAGGKGEGGALPPPDGGP